MSRFLRCRRVAGDATTLSTSLKTECEREGFTIYSYTTSRRCFCHLFSPPLEIHWQTALRSE